MLRVDSIHHEEPYHCKHPGYVHPFIRSMDRLPSSVLNRCGRRCRSFRTERVRWHPRRRSRGWCGTRRHDRPRRQCPVYRRISPAQCDGGGAHDSAESHLPHEQRARWHKHEQAGEGTRAGPYQRHTSSKSVESRHALKCASASMKTSQPMPNRMPPAKESWRARVSPMLFELHV